MSQPESDNGLTRVTVNLTVKSMAALDRITEADGCSKTDAINRSLQVYALVNELIRRCGGHLSVVNESGERERYWIL